jgi:hypothetical protein
VVRRLKGLPPSRALLLAGGVMFGVFAIVAFTLRRLDVDPGVTDVIAGSFAWAFLVVAAVILIYGWYTRERRAIAGQGLEFLLNQDQVSRVLGSPTRGAVVRTDLITAKGRPDEYSVECRLRGPLDSGRGTLLMRPDGDDWVPANASFTASDEIPRIL